MLSLCRGQPRALRAGEVGDVGAHAFLVSADAPAPADAVLYSMRHLHETDAAFLESFHDDRVVRATPVNAIEVLSRADEIGVRRIDSLFSALLGLDQVLRLRPCPGAGGVGGGADLGWRMRSLSCVCSTRCGRARLGLPTEAGVDELRRAALDALAVWQRRAESPLSPRAVADAARVVVRTCEGLLAALAGS